MICGGRFNDRAKRKRKKKDTTVDGRHISRRHGNRGSVRKPGTKALRATIKYRSTYLYDDLGYLRCMSMTPEEI